MVSRYHIAEIIEARMEEIFTFTNTELKSINRDGLLPGGAVLTGGGALLPGTVDLAKRILRLPAQIGHPKPLGGILDQVDTPQFATVVGLVLLAEESILGKTGRLRGWKSERLVPEWMSQTFASTQKFAKRFLP
jgi:cell division ATPase FtsA